MRVIYTTHGLVDQKSSISDLVESLRDKKSRCIFFGKSDSWLYTVPQKQTQEIQEYILEIMVVQAQIMHEENQKKFGSWTRRYREAEIVYNYLLSMLREIK